MAENKAAVDQATEYGTPLLIAAQEGRTEVAEALIREGDGRVCASRASFTTLYTS